ncbi:MAG TPA: hypothetical protein PLR51_00675 [Methanomassiliicoccales archaeon]|nr:hypothetical protein [Methanomassiliicoccales archaeon]
MVERVKVRSAFSASSRSKFIKRDKEGVASTVGTIMALLVFLTFLTMFTNTYIPIWMKENEKTHMDVVLNQFGDLKGKVDSLVVNAQVTGRPTINMYQPITLGSDGVPVFATATAGFMFLKPRGPIDVVDSGVAQNFSYLIEGIPGTQTFNDFGGGSLEFYGPNRYYVQQWYTYENGALLIYQEDGMAMRASPSLVFAMSEVDGPVDVQFDQIDIIGENNSIGGQGSGGVIIDLIYHDSQTYDVCTESGVDNGQLNLQFKTRYVDVWMNVIAEAANASEVKMVEDNDYTVDVQDVPSTNQYRPIYLITLTILNVDQFTHNRGYVTMELEY